MSLAATLEGGQGPRIPRRADTRAPWQSSQRVESAGRHPRRGPHQPPGAYSTEDETETDADADADAAFAAERTAPATAPATLSLKTLGMM